jgi:hypothetical protein
LITHNKDLKERSIGTEENACHQSLFRRDDKKFPSFMRWFS